MGYKGEFETLAGVFEAGWNGATPIAWGNLDFTPVTPLAPWVRFSVLPGEAFHATAGAPGANIVRHPGLITVQVFVPLNSGSVEALGLADDVAEIFRGYSSVGIRCGAPWITHVGGAGDDGWYQVNVNIPFVRDEAL